MKRLPALVLLILLILLATLAPPPAEVVARGGKAAGGAGPAFPRHVVLVVLGGGVRTADLRDVDLMPNLVALAAEGRLVDDVVSGAPDAYAAAARILTGRADAVDGAAKSRPRWPTIAERVRAERDLPAEKVWFVSFEGGDRLHLAWSDHPEHGAVVGPSTTYGHGPFGQPLRPFLEVLGRPLPMEPEAWTLLRGLRGISREAASIWLPASVDAGLPRSEGVERALLRELDRKALLNTSPGPRDEEAIRAALTVLEVHRPVLTVVLLGEAEQAQASYAAYRAVLGAADAGLGRLRAAVAADSEMAGATTFVVVPDRGRNEAPDAKGRLGADDASKGRGRVAAVLAGPGLARRPGRLGPRALEDLAPTIGHLLGVAVPDATGTAWGPLLAPR